MCREPVTNRVIMAVSGLTAALLWLAVLLIPVDWSVSSVPPTSGAINIGPVSSYVVPGQTILPPEPVTAIAVPVRVGGPFGAEVALRLSVLQEIRGWQIAAGVATATSSAAGFEMVQFDLERALPASVWAYVELEIPFETEWPTVVGGTTAGRPEFPGQLYLRGEAGWPDQDMFHQLLRQQNLAQRASTMWSLHRASLLAYVAILLAATTACVGLGLVVGERQPRLKWPVALTLLPAATAVYYLYALW